jgi:hypothetical protein
MMRKIVSMREMPLDGVNLSAAAKFFLKEHKCP